MMWSFQIQRAIERLTYDRISCFVSGFLIAMVSLAVFFVAAFLLGSVFHLFSFSSASAVFPSDYAVSAYTTVPIFGGSYKKDKPAVMPPSQLKLMGTLMSSNDKSVAVLSSSSGDRKTYVVKIGDELPDGSILKDIGVDHVVISNHGKMFRLEATRSNSDVVKFSS